MNQPTMCDDSLAWLQLPHHLAEPIITNKAHQLTLEDLKAMWNSCSLCDCSWQMDHLSLDCQECGGYAMQRPCPKCDGKCKSLWQRNIRASHDQRRACWTGSCKLATSTSSSSTRRDN